MLLLVKPLSVEHFDDLSLYARTRGWVDGRYAARRAWNNDAGEAPVLDLSGEWADEPTPAGVVSMLRTRLAGTVVAFGELCPEDADALVDLYATAWDDASAELFAKLDETRARLRAMAAHPAGSRR